TNALRFVPATGVPLRKTVANPSAFANVRATCCQEEVTTRPGGERRTTRRTGLELVSVRTASRAEAFRPRPAPMLLRPSFHSAIDGAEYNMSGLIHPSIVNPSPRPR